MRKIPMKIDIGIACNKWQDPGWWSPLVRQVGHLWRYGVEFGSLYTEMSTDIGRNRSVITRKFRQGDAEWLWFIDDDTIPCEHALMKLLQLNAPIAALPYFYKDREKHMFAPLIYMREENNRYKPITNYHRGEILEVDAVGMGMTLIHRSVFDAILTKYTVGIEDAKGAVVMIRKNSTPESRPGIRKGDAEKWEKHDYIPFFVSEKGRTEDYYFCELAADVGIKPVVDTLYECDHIGRTGYNGSNFRALRAMRRRKLSQSRQMGNPSLAVV